ncbi:Retrotransposon gag protein [Rhizoctonia solani]|uniref:Retrotransposon gag protein n=1 Tax=Rhizoctonia solani TaxID=456999 RepID=A0A8H8P1C6_9AGAM|nr:Retrotransposon gag protein [Rhizoctonia solani]QRW22560.1 Retrotransposon gag protein [Rhizoctonia solani]
MEPEPTLAALLKAITALTATVRSLQDKINSQGEQITQLTAICKETNDLVGDKDQGGAQTKPGPSTGPVTPPTHSGGETHTPGTIRPGLKAPSALQGVQGLTLRRKKNQVLPKKSLKERLEGTWGPSPPSMQGDERPLSGLTDDARAAARKIAALSQVTTTAEYVTEFRNLMAELDWNEEAYIAQFTQGLHWKVKELLSTKDSVPNKLEAIFAASIKIETSAAKTRRTAPRRRLPNPGHHGHYFHHHYSTGPSIRRPQLRHPGRKGSLRASGLCVKCGQKGHGIKQCPNGWKATVKEVAKVAEDVESGKD